MKKQRVVWTKGMFLVPQHFQALDQHAEEALHFRSKASNFANWGVVGMAIDEASLATGLFKLRHCEGVLADGLAFNMPEMDDLPAGRPVEAYFAPAQEKMDVYLAVPESRPHGQDFTQRVAEPDGSEGPPVSTRYLATTQILPDATGGTDEQPIQFAAKTFRLLFEGENLDGFTAMRIAQLVRSQTGVYALAPHFIPPLLEISASEYLMLLVRHQIEVLSAKAASLAVPRRQNSRNFAEFSPAESGNFWLLHTVNTNLPELKHLWKVRRGHPDVLFRTMLRLAGALSSFSPEANLGDLPDYDHDNLGPCFTELDARLRDLLETVLPTKCVVIQLESAGKLIWSGTITDDRYLRNSQCYLAVSARIAIDELIGKFPRLAKLSSPVEIDRLVQRSLPGVSLRHTPAPPPAVPVKMDHQYFSLGQSGALWEGVTQSRTINVFVPGEIASPKLELVIVLP